MKLIMDYLVELTNVATVDFENEISTDENRDYRRGFRAGALFSYLNLLARIRMIEDASTEQQK